MSLLQNMACEGFFRRLMKYSQCMDVKWKRLIVENVCDMSSLILHTYRADMK